MVERDLNAGLLILEAELGGWLVCLDLYLSSWQGSSPMGAGEVSAAPSPCICKEVGSLGEEVRARGILPGPGSSPASKTEGAPLQASAAH